LKTLPLTLGAQLDRLENAQLLRRADDSELAYSFKHTLTQKTAYQSLLQKRRREVHRIVAEAYESAYAESLAQFAPVLAKHYAESGDESKTLTYATLAGDEAAQVTVDSIAQKLTGDLKQLFLKLPDVVYALEVE
jgi:predicted ATPase